MMLKFCLWWKMLLVGIGKFVLIYISSRVAASCSRERCRRSLFEDSRKWFISWLVWQQELKRTIKGFPRNLQGLGVKMLGAVVMYQDYRANSQGLKGTRHVM